MSKFEYVVSIILRLCMTILISVVMTLSVFGCEYVLRSTWHASADVIWVAILLSTVACVCFVIWIMMWLSIIVMLWKD